MTRSNSIITSSSTARCNDGLFHPQDAIVATNAASTSKSVSVNIGAFFLRSRNRLMECGGAVSPSVGA